MATKHERAGLVLVRRERLDEVLTGLGRILAKLEQLQASNQELAAYVGQQREELARLRAARNWNHATYDYDAHADILRVWFAGAPCPGVVQYTSGDVHLLLDPTTLETVGLHIEGLVAREAQADAGRGAGAGG